MIIKNVINSLEVIKMNDRDKKQKTQQIKITP